jgi:hypothetical protein
MPHSYPLSWFWDLYQRKLIDMNPPYQRQSVWNQAYRDYFIDTLLLGYPTPVIFLYQEIEPSGRTTYSVVDGKQRLETVFAFASDHFPVSDKAELTNLRGRYFSQLEDGVKTKFWGYIFTVEYISTVAPDVINNIFDRINRNVAKLTPQELRHARFDGPFITCAEELTEWLHARLPDFPRITQTSRKQMKDVEFVAHLLLLLEQGPKGYSVAELDSAFSERDTSWDERQQIESEFRAAIDVLGGILTAPHGSVIRQSRFRNQADFYSLFGAVAGLVKEGAMPEPTIAAANLAAFLGVLESEEARATVRQAQTYYDAARSASNDAGPRKVRIEIMTRVLRGLPLA